MSINGGMDEEVVDMYNGILLSHKKDGIMPYAATWMQLDIILSEISERKDKCHVLSLMSGSKQ